MNIFSDQDEDDGKNFPKYHINPSLGQNKPNELLENGEKFDFEVFVVGGGSGGAAFARYCATACYSVGLTDYVDPSWHGSTWGIGGTCVNVGCIPKKLMHTASLMGENFGDIRRAGWNVGEPEFNWGQMRSSVQEYVKSLNQGISDTLMNSGVVTYNSKAFIVDNHTIELTSHDGKKSTKTAKYIVLATGGRPKSDQFEGCKEHCISSDEIFSLEKAPGKTLVIGASYISLETAGFLRGLGYEVDIIVRSILLRGFDQEIAEMIGDYMQEMGCKFIRPSTVTKVEESQNGRKLVHYKNPNGDGTITEEYDTVMIAVGRTPNTKNIGLENINAVFHESGKIVTNKKCVIQSNKCSNVFAIGDIVQGKHELTPTAILDGKLLAGRLLGVHNENMNWEKVATTVFTPLEYGCIGLSEEQCKEKYGDNFKLYAKNFRPLEWEFKGRPESHKGYIKLLCEGDKNETIVGIHYLGPNAGEVIQGYAVAVRLGATKYDFDCTIGIHPTSSENLLSFDSEGKGVSGPC